MKNIIFLTNLKNHKIAGMGVNIHTKNKNIHQKQIISL